MFLDYLESAIALASIAIGISMVWKESAKQAPSFAPRKKTHS